MLKRSNDSEKDSNDAEKLSNDAEKLSNDAEKLSNDAEKDSQGKTPLMVAVTLGNVEMVQQLLDKGAEVLDRDSLGNGVLTLAASKANNHDVIAALLSKGADVHERDSLGVSPLMKAAQVGAFAVIELLLNSGARTTDHDDGGKTALHYAAKHGYHKSCQLLLSRNANVNAVDKDNRTPLIIAAMTGNGQAVKCLVSHNAKLDWQDNDGKTALHYAAENGFPDIVQLLLQHRAKRGLVDHRTMTAEQLAEENLRTSVVAVLNGEHVESPIVSPIALEPAAGLLAASPPIVPSPAALAPPAIPAIPVAKPASVKNIEKQLANLVITPENTLQIGSITMYKNQIIGRGSYGSTVFHGKFQKTRPCAVKQMSKRYYSIADNEVDVLLKSDGHPNVVRYFAREEDDEFIYLATEYCLASFRDVVERSRVPAMFELRGQILKLTPSHVVRQVMSGIQYLHSLGIVIRNIKPENVLFAHKPGLPLRVVLSDFGVGKPALEMGPLSSGSNGPNGLDACFPVASAENLQWQPPEIIASLRAARIAAGTSLPSLAPNRPGRAKSPAPRRSRSPSITSSGVAESIEDLCKRDITPKVDIFSAGLTLYFFLSDGGHPFGLPKQRRTNILENRTPKLDRLEGSVFAMGEVEEVRSLIRRMIQYHSEDRPSATQVLSHVYFWSGTKKLEFLREAADRFKIEVQDPPSFILRKLEAKARVIFSPYGDWFEGVDRLLLENLAKNAKYDKDSVRDLLKAIRNLKNHYTEQPDEIKRLLGPLSGAFLHYWTARFPNLLMSVYSVAYRDTQLAQEPGFRVFLES